MEVSVLERCPSYGMSVLRGFTVSVFCLQHASSHIWFVFYHVVSSSYTGTWLVSSFVLRFATGIQLFPPSTPCIYSRHIGLTVPIHIFILLFIAMSCYMLCYMLCSYFCSCSYILIYSIQIMYNSICHVDSQDIFLDPYA